MPTIIRGNGGVDADVDEARNIQIYQTIPGYPAAGGFYSVAGKSGAATIAAALATDTTLMSMRFSASSTRRAYVGRIRVNMATLTAGAAGGVPSVLGLQRFNSATPSGGTARTPSRFALSKGSATDMTDVRDNNAALTVTSVVFLDEIAWSLTPTNGVLVSNYDWVIEPPAPIELAAGEGLVLRTRQVGPATATWFFSYNVYWFER
jgi:hypothetical protein